MKKVTRFLCTALACALIALPMSGCGGDGGEKNPSGDKDGLSGELTIGTLPKWVEDVTAYVENFNKIYPNVQVEVVGFEGKGNDYLTAQAAISDLPDLIYGFSSDSNVRYSVEQGWAYPIDEYVNADEEFKEINQASLQAYTYGGKLYGLPYELEFDAFVINMDLVDLLNLDAPGMDWTLTEYLELLKAATTNEYSGQNALGNFSQKLTGVYGSQGQLGAHGYNRDKNTVTLTDGAWVNAQKFIKTMKDIPQLLSDTMKDQAKRNAGELDDYQKKFGENSDAAREGKVLFMFKASWDWAWVNSLSNDWQYLPLPHPEGQPSRQSMHTKWAMMMSTTKYPDAAFALLKHLTYGKDGNVSKLEYLKGKTDEEGKPANQFYIPVTSNDAVNAAFRDLGFVPEGLMWLYENMDTDAYETFRSDWYKDVAGWGDVSSNMSQQAVKCESGEVQPEAVAKETETMCNEILAREKAISEEAIAAAQASFADTRAKIEGQ